MGGRGVRTNVGKWGSVCCHRKDCLKAPDKMSELYLHGSTSLDDSGIQWKNKAQIIVKTDKVRGLEDEHINLC